MSPKEVMPYGETPIKTYSSKLHGTMTIKPVMKQVSFDAQTDFTYKPKLIIGSRMASNGQAIMLGSVPAMQGSNTLFQKKSALKQNRPASNST